MSLSTSSFTSTKPGNYKSCTWSLVTRTQRKLPVHLLVDHHSCSQRVQQYQQGGTKGVWPESINRSLLTGRVWCRRIVTTDDKQCWKVPCVWIEEDRLFHLRWISMGAVPQLQIRTGLQPTCVLFINDTRTHNASISAVYDVVASPNSCSHQTRSTPVWVWSNGCWHNTSVTASIVQARWPAPSMQMPNIMYEYQNVHLQSKEHKMCDLLWL